jgi:hypothetical protein
MLVFWIRGFVAVMICLAVKRFYFFFEGVYAFVDAVVLHQTFKVLPA